MEASIGVGQEGENGMEKLLLPQAGQLILQIW
jgi:hypothetical protein